MTATRKTKIPDVPAVAAQGEHKVFFDAVKEVLDIAHRRRGDPLDGFVTYRDLKDSGLASVSFAGSKTGSGGTLGGPGGGGPGGIFITPHTPGTRPPPSGLTITTASAWDAIIVKIEVPPGFFEYVYFEVYAAKQIDPLIVPTFAQATLVGTTAGSLFVHQSLGLGAVWYYWVRSVGFPTADNTIPYGDFAPPNTGPGVRGTTAIDPTYVLGVLTDQITESQLYGVLNKRIDLVDFYYDATGTKVPVPTVSVFDVNGNVIPGLSVQNIQNRIVAAVKDTSGFTVEIQEFREIVINQLGLFAAAGLKIDAGGYIAGWGLSVESVIDPVTGLPLPVIDHATGLYNPGALTSDFEIRAAHFAIISPDEILDPRTGLPHRNIPFIVGLVNNVPTVGVNGQLVVDGTLTATAIQAGTIGAREINAQSVWAKIVTANRVFASEFATAADLNYRVAINGQGTAGDVFPLWYGSGEMSNASSDLSNPIFFLDRNGNVKLAGNLTVTGVGQFSTDGGTGSDPRIEIGGHDGFLLWAGSGVRNADNARFYFTRQGDLYIRGNPITFPVAQGDTGAGQTPSVVLTVLPVANQDRVPVWVQAFAVVGMGTNEIEKTVETQILIDSSVVDDLRISTRAYTFPVYHMAVLNLPPGTYTLNFNVQCIEVKTGETIPSTEIFNGRMIALQTAASSG